MSQKSRFIGSVAFVMLSFPGALLAEETPVHGDSPGTVTAAPDHKTNIVLIMADDLGYGSLGCYGHKDIKTPNINRLAAGGVRLTDFHSNGPFCTPTRAALMTGRYQQRCAWVPDEELSPVFREQRKQNLKQRWAWGISTKELTIPALLGQAGYRTTLIGKWHLGYDSAFHPMNFGFHEFRGFVGGNVDYHEHVAGYGTKELDWWMDRKIENEQGYTTDLLAKHAADFIARNKAHPFFLYLAHGAPHDPWQGRDPAGKKPPAETYREMIEVLDESVGEVIAALHDNGLENDTLVIFTSDNGPAAPPGFSANGKLRGKKGTLYEGGHRVPFIASWPGVIAPGTTCGEALMSMDLLPTFAALAGAKAPADHVIDGIDAMPILKGTPPTGHRNLHWQSGNSWAVRSGPWKLSGSGGKSLTLVNLEKDIGEKHNRMKEEPERAEELMKLHREWIGSVGER